jgi:hypothetical protein
MSLVHLLFGKKCENVKLTFYFDQNKYIWCYSKVNFYHRIDVEHYFQYNEKYMNVVVGIRDSFICTCIGEGKIFFYLHLYCWFLPIRSIRLLFSLTADALHI